MTIISKTGATGDTGPPGDDGPPGEEGTHFGFFNHIEYINFFTDHSNKHVD